VEVVFCDLWLEGVFGSTGLLLVQEILLDTLPDLVSQPTKDPEPLNGTQANVRGEGPGIGLERVMNSIRNGLGMRETEIAREPSRPWNPHFYAIFAQVHNTL
jgi:hypothetical protein